MNQLEAELVPFLERLDEESLSIRLKDLTINGHFVNDNGLLEILLSFD